MKPKIKRKQRKILKELSAYRKQCIKNDGRRLMIASIFENHMNERYGPDSVEDVLQKWVHLLPDDITRVDQVVLSSLFENESQYKKKNLDSGGV